MALFRTFLLFGRSVQVPLNMSFLLSLSITSSGAPDFSCFRERFHGKFVINLHRYLQRLTCFELIVYFFRVGVNRHHSFMELNYYIFVVKLPIFITFPCASSECSRISVFHYSAAKNRKIDCNTLINSGFGLL